MANPVHVCRLTLRKGQRLTHAQLTEEFQYHEEGRIVINGRTYEIINTRIHKTAEHLVSLVDVT